MLKKLRIKFIVITMIAVVTILAAIMLTVNAVNYASVMRSADEVVTFLSQNNGEFPMADRAQGREFPEKPEWGEPEERRRYELPKDMSIETPFDTRFFKVTYSSGEITEVDVDNVAAVTEEQAREMANKAISKNRTSGTYGVYRYGITDTSDGKMVIFVDISRELEPMNGFLLVSLIVMGVCTILFFVGIVLISKPVLKPIIESYTRQKRFITDAGHELKTPLTIISANNEIQEIEGGETECTRAIAKQVSRMTTMVKNLTELARMDEEENFRKKSFDLSEAFCDVANSFENVFEKNGKKLTVQCRDKITYFGTEALLRRLFTLLLENASKYSVSYAKAELTKKGKQVVLTVRNDAEGIENGDLNKCFERFYRSDEARASQTEGSGIGLSTAQEIVRLHKGAITAEGKDNEFVIKAVL